MPIVTVTHTVRTYYEVPEGWTIEELRREVYDNPGLIDGAEELRKNHCHALSEAYGGKSVQEVGNSEEFHLHEGYDRS